MSTPYNSPIEVVYSPSLEPNVKIKIEPNQDVKTEMKPEAIITIDSSNTSESDSDCTQLSPRRNHKRQRPSSNITERTHKRYRKLSIKLYRLKLETRSTGPVSKWLLVKFDHKSSDADGLQWVSVERMMSIAPDYTQYFCQREYKRILKSCPMFKS